MENDIALVEKLKSGDEEAVALVVDQYGERFLRGAFAITGDLQLAEEVVQDTFIKTCRKIKSFQGKSSLETWMYRIMINTAKNYMRSSWIRKVTSWDTQEMNHLKKVSQNDPEIRSYDPEIKTLEQEQKELIISCLRNLPLIYREVLVLYYMHDLKVEEISEILNEPDGTVKSKLARGRKRLKKLLAERGAISFE